MALTGSCLFFFVVAALGAGLSTNYGRYNDGLLGHRPHVRFQSSTETGPVLQVNSWDQKAIAATGSHIFLRNDGNEVSPLSSPLILDAADLTTVYLNRSFEHVFGTRVQENKGKRYLTFWAGGEEVGFGDGYGLVFDDTYRLVHAVAAQNLTARADLHEFALTGHGTALVTAVDKVVANTTGWRHWFGPESCRILDSVFQEIDLETNALLFQWRALDHLDPSFTFEPRGRYWDAFHTNSIQKTKAGNYLISMRHMHSIFLIDGRTGDVLWTLGGKKNDFVELAPDEGVDPVRPVVQSMKWQHHAQYVPGTEETQITVFDNYVRTTSHEQCTKNCTRGLRLAVDDKASPPTVKILREYHHPSRLQAQSQGSVQVLQASPHSEGNVFIGWGRCPSFTEHTPDGETVLDVQFSPWHSDLVPDAMDNYRAYKMDWVATPHWDPAMAAAVVSRDKMLVFVSWNGATEVRQWVVRGVVGDQDSKNGSVLAESPRTDFETEISVALSKDLRYVWADALGRNGTVLGSTGPLFISSLFGAAQPQAESMEAARLKHVVFVRGKWLVVYASVGLIFSVLVTVAIVLRGRISRYRQVEDFDLDSDSDEEYE